jgi:deoxycytidine triphosphate deaminase
MYGNTLSNASVKELIKHRDIQFVNFDDSNLRLSHYRLRPGQLWKPGIQKDDGSHRRVHVHDFEDGPYEFQPNEYLIVTAIEQIVLCEGMTGEVIGASTLIEQCFGLTSGKLDPGYGALGGNRQEFIMGLKNMLDQPNSFYPNQGVANISFIDFRGTRRLATTWSPRDLQEFDERKTTRRLRAEDDGPEYMDEEG